MPGGGVLAEFAAKWTWGSQTAASAAGAPAPDVGSTGAGRAVNTFAISRQLSFYIEADVLANSTCAYQIRTARTSSGPWVVISSGTLATTNTADLVQIPGPLAWVSPRLKSIGSTAGLVTIEAFGN